VSLPLPEALRQSRSHALYLQSALDDIQLPLTQEALDEGNRHLIRALDQLILRFIKLQDTMGEHVLRGFAVQVLLEPVDDAVLADILSLLEKHGYLSVNDWLKQRKLRNALTHEYPEQNERRVAALNAAFSASRQLMEWLDAFERKTQSAWPST
jgi:hypothetical protein